MAPMPYFCTNSASVLVSLIRFNGHSSCDTQFCYHLHFHLFFTYRCTFTYFSRNSIKMNRHRKPAGPIEQNSRPVTFLNPFLRNTREWWENGTHHWRGGYAPNRGCCLSQWARQPKQRPIQIKAQHYQVSQNLCPTDDTCHFTTLEYKLSHSRPCYSVTQVYFPLLLSVFSYFY